MNELQSKVDELNSRYLEIKNENQKTQSFNKAFEEFQYIFVPIVLAIYLILILVIILQKIRIRNTTHKIDELMIENVDIS